ncbi:hypothetical protein Y88_2219 [Novosphingobium nitrogenifigens DSM 19370]|uniref:DUF58 domain-containing protein n=1 Tax=Novosphingobium nitrogenifigens DSM 19370 TaxID=983920 RepID=F1Z5G7_9SPHN|nr:DUF58 domain-containing protein [Novosphingobium nitrogenifigens]EGD60345.1 hypothetical protein Y88_2219 [Novosphingobium nitrogenifigens DSM 19370]
MVPAPVLSSPAPIADDWRPRIAGLHPTARAIRLLVLLALAALIVASIAPGAWTVAPAAGGALFLLILGDAALAGSVTAFRLHAPEDGEVGEALLLRVEVELSRGSPRTGPAVALATDPRLAPGGRIDIALTGGEPGQWLGIGSPAPSRRGTARITRGWLRWQGPLGLAHRQVHRDFDRDVRIWPNIAPARGAALQIFLREAQQGLVARRIRGEGTEFEALAEYQPGMDRRRIDWKSSARHSRLFAREYETERNNQIVFAFDCGQAMCEPIGGLARIDRAVTAALTTAWVALKAEDRVALFGFASRPLVMSPFVTAPHQFRRLQEAAAALDYCAEEPNFTLAMASLSARLQRRSLIVVFSDFNDPTGAELMIEMCTRLVERHRVVFLVMRDEDLDTMAEADVEAIDDAARAVVASTLIRQRALVLTRLRQAGIMVIEAPWETIGNRLLDAYLTIKREGSIG